jgi:hypothetical protein
MPPRRRRPLPRPLPAAARRPLSRRRAVLLADPEAPDNLTKFTHKDRVFSKQLIGVGHHTRREPLRAQGARPIHLLTPLLLRIPL